MAYIKTTWEDLPSEDTPIVSTALQNIEDGIEALDTGKVNKADIVDNLTTDDATKVLSAKQGKALNDGKLDKTSIEETSSAITLPDGTKIIFGTTVAYVFSGAGTKTETISLATYNLSAIYSATISAQCTYVDSQYMKDTVCYVHSKSKTELKVNIVNAYPITIGYYVNYIVIGK